MRRLRIPEYRTRSFSPLDPADAQALAATGAVEVSTDLAGRTLITTGSQVGVLRTSGVQLSIIPKLRIARLLWLLGYATDPDGWRHSERVLMDDSQDLVPAMAISFLDAVNTAFAHGVLQGYHTREESSSVVRGRVREAEQMRRRFGFPVPVEVRFDDYDTDIPENQTILAATLRLLPLPGSSSQVRAGLRHAVTQLADVSVPPRGLPPPQVHTTRRTRHYRAPLDLARIILAGRSIDQRCGDVRTTGFLFDLNVVYEQWLTAVIRQTLRPYGGTLTGQWPDYLDVGRGLFVKPDLVWHRARQPLFVADAKYKDLGTGAPPTGDIYQLIAYAGMLNLPSGHLIYGSGSDSMRAYTIRNTGITIHAWSVDLSKPVPQLLGDIEVLVRRLIDASSTG